MKITCSRRDELLKERSEYKAARKAAEDASARQWQNYESAVAAIYTPIVEDIKAHLSQYTALTFDVEGDIGVGTSIRITVSCNEHNKFDENVALSWRWGVQVDRGSGEVQRSSSSWSGLKATTKEQMDSLRQSVDALDYLNNIDWEAMLNITYPKYQDFKDPDAPKMPEYRDFDKEIESATIEELIGQNKAIVFYNPGTDSIVWRTKYLAGKILRDSGSQYTVEYTYVPSSWRDDFDGATSEIIDHFENGRTYTGRIRKDKFSIVTPEHIIDL